MNKYKLSILFLLTLLLLSCGEVGTEFDNYGDFMNYENEEGFIFLGRFQDVWPAEITCVEKEMNEITFVLPDGTPHTYSGFEGYELKVVKFNSRKWKKKFIVVLRSKEKTEEEKDIY